MLKSIFISEVAPRDGLQNCHGLMPTDVKKRSIKSFYDTGVRKIEVGVSSAFGCSIVGQVPEYKVVEFSERWIANRRFRLT